MKQREMSLYQAARQFGAAHQLLERQQSLTADELDYLTRALEDCRLRLKQAAMEFSYEVRTAQMVDLDFDSLPLGKEGQ